MLNQMKELKQAGQDQIVLFTLDEPRYALYLSAVERVVRAVEVTPLPNAPGIVLGAINWQGKIIPVMDIRKRFNLPAREMDLDDRFIIARAAGRLVALAAESVAGIRGLTEQESASAAQAAPFAGDLKGVAKVDGDLVLICDLDRFLSPDEEQKLDAAISGAGT